MPCKEEEDKVNVSKLNKFKRVQHYKKCWADANLLLFYTLVEQFCTVFIGMDKSFGQSFSCNRHICSADPHQINDVLQVAVQFGQYTNLVFCFAGLFPYSCHLGIELFHQGIERMPVIVCRLLFPFMPHFKDSFYLPSHCSRLITHYSENPRYSRAILHICQKT